MILPYGKLPKTKEGAVKRLIDSGLNNTSVTCFLIGEKTYSRPWCQYELNKSLEDKKGIIGILLPNQEKHGPLWISRFGAPVYKWDHTKFAEWIEAAAQKAGR
ncbi:MAG: TIR domain-containing protein [Candidatus Moraniibacteriota bacterium]